MHLHRWPHPCSEPLLPAQRHPLAPDLPTTPSRHPPHSRGLAAQSLTFSSWMGLVTLNLSIVDRMMEGVVRKNSPTKSVKLIPSHWNHQRKPWMDRFFLQGEDTGPGGLSPGLWLPAMPAAAPE